MDIRGRIVEALLGHNARRDVTIKGMSGVEHRFDIVVEAEGMRIPIKVLDEDVVLDELKFIRIYTEMLDVNLKAGIIIADKFDEAGFNLAKELNVLILKTEEAPMKIKEFIKTPPPRASRSSSIHMSLALLRDDD